MFTHKGTLGSFLFLLCGIISSNSVRAILSQDEIDQKCLGQDLHRLSVTGKCGQFIQCVFGTGLIYDCPSMEPCFEKTVEKCVTTNECSCQEAPPDWVKVFCHQTQDSWNTMVHAEDCSMFYRCMGPELDPITLQCPNGYHYSRLEENCVTPLKAGCKGLKGMCYDEPDGFTFPGLKCADYYECCVDKETPIFKTCGDGFHFDGSTGRCISSTYSSCVDDVTEDTTNAPDTTTTTTTPAIITSTTTTTTSSTTTPSTTTTTSTPMTQTTTQYTTTTSTTQSTTTTNATPSTTTITTTPSTTTTSTSVFVPMVCSPAHEGQSFPYLSCNMFYICKNNKPVIYQCGDNHIYDESIHLCIFDSDNRCVA